MNNKKVGVTLLIIGIIFGGILISIFNELARSGTEIGCNLNEACRTIESSFSIVHLSFGVLGFLLALGVYLLVFSKGEEMIMNKLEESTKATVRTDKFRIILSVLDEAEKKVLKAIKEHEGITQSTLMLRTDLSKTKLSYVVNDLEKRGIIKRKPHKKTFKIFLAMRL